MAGIFNISSYSPTKSLSGRTVINAPLLLQPGNMPKAYHSKATLSKKSAFLIDPNGDFINNLMRVAGKRKKGGRKAVDNRFAPLSGVIYNVAKRPATRSERENGVNPDGTYYAKFFEYGFTVKLADGSEKFIPGRRLFKSSKKKFQNWIAQELRRVPDIYDQRDLRRAMSRALARMVEDLKQQVEFRRKRPGTGLMNDSWGYHVDG